MCLGGSCRATERSWRHNEGFWCLYAELEVAECSSGRNQRAGSIDNHLKIT
jgi:hypothetical protein